MRGKGLALFVYGLLSSCPSTICRPVFSPGQLSHVVLYYSWLCKLISVSSSPGIWVFVLVPYCFYVMDLWHDLESDMMIPSAEVIRLRIALAIRAFCDSV